MESPAIDAIAQPGAPEYCLFWIRHWVFCMSKAEWSGWAQAIGSMVALGLTLWVAGKSRRDIERDAYRSARSFLVQAVGTYKMMVAAARSDHWDSFLAGQSVLQHLAHQAPQVPVGSLDEDVALQFMICRSEVIATLKLLPEKRPARMEQSVEHLENRLKLAEGQLKLVPLQRPRKKPAWLSRLTRTFACRRTAEQSDRPS